MTTPTPSAPHESGACAGCSRRQFLASASVLSLSTLAVACGDGVISEPAVRLPFPDTPFTINPASVPGLQALGGRAVITSGLDSPVLVERMGAQQFRALSLVCPHKGTIVDVRSSGFVCPNHGATFALDGRWEGGQPTVDLSPVNVRPNADGTITIGGPPVPPTLALSASSVVFATTVTGTTIAPQSLAVTNAGGSILGGLQVALAYPANQPGGWLTVSLDQASAPATLSLRAARGTLAAGTYTALLTVSAPGSTNGAQSVPVSLVVQDPNGPPALQLSAPSLAFTGAAGTTIIPQTVQLTNSGGGTIAGLSTSIVYGAGATGWLSVALSQLTAPTTLTVRPTLTTLAAGSYTATIIIAAPGVPARSISVALTVTSAGLRVVLSAWPALANVGGVAGSVGTLNGGPVAVARTGPSSFLAFSMRCPHAGTTINVVNNASFRCPNHGALFNGQGVWQQSPQQTTNLVRLTVSYTPGDTALVVT